MTFKTGISDKNEKLTVKIEQHKKEIKLAQREQEMLQTIKSKGQK